MKFTDAEVKEMLRRGACLCGIEDAERHPEVLPSQASVVVPTSPNCTIHRGAK